MRFFRPSGRQPAFRLVSGLLGAAAIAAAIAAASPVAAQALVTEHTISTALALEIAQAALASCTATGYHVAVTVLDRAGRPIVVLRDALAGLNTLEGSQKKAFTARTFGVPSAEFAKRVLSNPELTGQRDYTGVILLGGGLPIKSGDEVVGAIGVSGGVGAGKDEICARAGLDKIGEALSQGVPH